METFRNIIVIGASAGGLPAIRELVSKLPADIDAAVFVVLHLSRKSSSENISRLLQKRTSLICSSPADRTPIEKGHLYLAPANYHMMVKDGQIMINQGARENKYRPSIDVLFRSAAVHYGSRAIGIILTGMLEDGTSGMSAVKRCGGICIVQEPSTAEYDEMPQSVINHIQVDYRTGLDEMSYVLADIMAKPLPPAITIPRELQIEAQITENMMTPINYLKEIADHSDFTCPECGGGLWAVRNDPAHRYRCHTGHVYTENMLLDSQGQCLEESVWVCIRMLEEKRNLLNLMATHAQESENMMLAYDYKDRANDIDFHIEGMKFILMKLTSQMTAGDTSEDAVA